MDPVYWPSPITEGEISYRSQGGLYASFHAALYRALQPRQSLKLTITLRIDLEQAEPNQLLASDSDGKKFFTEPWTTDHWTYFVAVLADEAQMWNDRFWLVPPSSATGFEEDDGSGRVWRPNIKCELDVEWAPGGHADKKVTVVCLDPSLTKLLNDQGINFRADNTLISSDASSREAYIDSQGNTAKQYTIVHEIGHNLGLDHIGIVLDTNLCRIARQINFMGLSSSSPFSGGPDAKYCYGFDEPLSVASNIMGIGSEFTAEDASPWMNALIRLPRTTWGSYLWTPVAKFPGTGSYV